MKTMNSFSIAALSLALVLLGSAQAGAGVIVPADYRADTDEKTVALRDYGAVETGPNYDNMYGNVLFETGGAQVPSGWRLWFLKESNRAVGGVFDTTDADPEGFWRVYGEAGVNNSLVTGDVLAVVAQDLSDDTFYVAYFDDAPVTYQDWQGAPAIEANIIVTDTVIPEPATLALLAAGGFLVVSRQRRRWGGD